jgi:hypothetical protein
MAGAGPRTRRHRHRGNRREDEPDRKQIARQLADLPDRERIWGRDATIETRVGGSKRSR